MTKKIWKCIFILLIHLFTLAWVSQSMMVQAAEAAQNTPVKYWQTFGGGAGIDEGRALAVDSGGNIYLTGSSNAAWGNPIQAFSENVDAYVAKLDRKGNLVWNTFFGGTGIDIGNSIAVDANGNVIVAGNSLESWGNPLHPFQGKSDAFVIRLNPNGNRTWHTFIGGKKIDSGNGITADTLGNIYLTGYSQDDWGELLQPFSGGAGDIFIAKLDRNGNLAWNTFLGGKNIDIGNGIAVDQNLNIYITGESQASWGTPINSHAGGSAAFLAKLNPNGSLSWNTFMGGNGIDTGNRLALDADGYMFVIGNSMTSWGTPLNPHTGKTDAFVAKFDAAGALLWNTFLGGDNIDIGRDISIDSANHIYITGDSLGSWGNPVNPHSGWDEAFITRMDGNGQIIWNLFQGGPNVDIARAIVAAHGNIYITGDSYSSWGKPHNPHSGNWDAFVIKWVPVISGTITCNGEGLSNVFLRGLPEIIRTDVQGNYSSGVDGLWQGTVSPVLPGYGFRPRSRSYSGPTDNLAGQDYLGKPMEDLQGTWPGLGIWNRRSADGLWTKINILEAYQLTTADLDGDRRDDLLGLWDAGIWVRYHSGIWEKLYNSFGVISIAAGDINGGGQADLLGSWKDLGVWARYSETGYWERLNYLTPMQVAAGDFDGDGSADILGAWEPGIGIWMRFSKDGSWLKILESQYLRFLTAGDMNGDGSDDVLGSWTHGVWWRDSATRKWPKLYHSADLIASGDINGEGEDDLLGAWSTVPGVWVQYSEDGSWELLHTLTPAWITSGRILD